MDQQRQSRWRTIRERAGAAIYGTSYSVRRWVAEQEYHWRTFGNRVLRAIVKMVLWAIVGIIALVVLIRLIRLGYAYHWTGFGQSKAPPAVQPAKTLWDWLSLLVVPIVLALGGYLFTRSENRRTQETSDQRRRDETLQAYLDQIGQLLLDKDRPLRQSNEGDEVRTLARARTLTVLSRMDGDRKATVLQFLYESNLIAKDNGIVDLRGADLRGTDLHRAALNKAKLSGAVLSGVDLSIALLVEADLRGADLSRANLRGAILTGANLGEIEPVASHMGPWGWADPQTATNLKGANLKGAILIGANLERANFSEADLTNAQVIHRRTAPYGILLEFKGWCDLEEATNLWLEHHAGSLQGATLPNGQKYERWRRARRTKELLKEFEKFQEGKFDS